MFFYKKLDSIKLRKFNLKGVKDVKKKRLCFGFYGLQALETGRLNSKQLDAVSQSIRRKLKPLGGKFWLRLNPSISVTKKPSSVRMGKGKGNIDRYVAFVRKGQILYEISNLKKSIAQDILKLGSSKIPIKTKIVYYV